MSDTSVEQKAARIRLLVLDVDGVLTDGSIYYGNDGEELKAFSIRDGLGVKLLQRCQLKVAIITGRDSHIVSRRAKELGISEVVQGREDKREALLELCEKLGIAVENCAYMGDDLPDLGAINIAGLGLTVANAAGAVRMAADWSSKLNGGQGAVRDACEFILAARGELSDLETEYT
jgi:3-deoxy-D-manno-octulosonate 8-phosphate phosphatase (KDO 8-P phosphatase)